MSGYINITKKQMSEQKGKQNNHANKRKDYDLRYGFFKTKPKGNAVSLTQIYKQLFAAVL